MVSTGLEWNWKQAPGETEPLAFLLPLKCYYEVDIIVSV